MYYLQSRGACHYTWYLMQGIPLHPPASFKEDEDKLEELFDALTANFRTSVYQDVRSMPRSVIDLIELYHTNDTALKNTKNNDLGINFLNMSTEGKAALLVIIELTESAPVPLHVGDFSLFEIPVPYLQYHSHFNAIGELLNGTEQSKAALADGGTVDFKMIPGFHHKVLSDPCNVTSTWYCVL